MTFQKQICAVQGCLEKKTSYKKSAFCAPHTCKDLFCKKATARLQDYCPGHGGSRWSVASMAPTLSMMRPTSSSHEVKKKDRAPSPDYSICTIRGCQKKKTPFKRSAFCANHTCDDSSCKNIKMNDHPRFCNLHKCDGPDCSHERSTIMWPGTTYCLYHTCSKCQMKLAVLGPGQFKFCTDCGVRCAIAGCDNPSTDNNSRYCADHKCLYPQCDPSIEGSYRDMPESSFCWKHRCKRCKGHRIHSGDAEYCGKCLYRCMQCDAPRPSDHTARLYYCDKHGCTQCHTRVKTPYKFLGESRLSDKCCQHTVFPSMPDTMEWTEEIRNAAKKLNDTIDQKRDAEEYNLTCIYYCSDGYCNCELMPYIWTDDCSTIDKKGVSRRGEHVFLLSDIALGEEGSYAWTIPRSGTAEMIQFELISK